jgi:hypothetical protein
LTIHHDLQRITADDLANLDAGYLFGERRYLVDFLASMLLAALCILLNLSWDRFL